MPTVAAISDTHIPDREADIPPSFVDRIRSADHLIHAGDFTTGDVLERVRSLSGGELTAVSGNMDPSTLDLPDLATVTIAGQSFVVTHGTGALPTYERRVSEIARETDPSAIAIAGHTHTVLDEVVNGVRVLNPGSVTGAAPASSATMMVLEIRDDTVEVFVHTAER